MDCRVGECGNCGPQPARVTCRSGLLGGCGGQLGHWALAGPAKALPNLPSYLVLAPTQSVEEGDTSLSPLQQNLQSLFTFSPPITLLLLSLGRTRFRLPQKHPCTTLYQVARVEVTRNLHVAKSNGQFSIQTKTISDPSAALTPPRSPSSLRLPSLALQDPTPHSWFSSDPSGCSFSILLWMRLFRPPDLFPRPLLFYPSRYMILPPLWL